jgi:hypothetical protein
LRRRVPRHGKYDSVASLRTKRIKDNRNSSDAPIRSIRIEIDQVVLEGFNDKQIDNDKLAANIIANLSLLVQNNAESISYLAFDTKVNNNNKTDYKIKFPIGNAFGERSSIYMSTVNAGSFQLSSSEGTNSTNIGQSVSTSIFRGLLGLTADKKE